MWVVACAVKGLASGQAAILKELVDLQNSLIRLEDHLELLSDNIKSIVDSVELFTCGERYLWVREMGKLEVPEDLEYIPRKTQWQLDSIEQRGRDPIRELEVELGVEPDVVPVDVEMTLQ